MKRKIITVATFVAATLISKSALANTMQTVSACDAVAEEQLSRARPWVFEMMKLLLVSEFDIEASSVTEDAKFKHDLFLDSLDMVGFLANCEVVFQVHYDTAEVMSFYDILTFGDLVTATYDACSR